MAWKLSNVKRYIQRFGNNIYQKYYSQKRIDMVIPFLEKLTKDIDEKVKNLNNGGCGIFACLVSEQLHKRNIPHHFVVRNTRLYKKHENVKWKTNNLTKHVLENNNFTASHVFLKVRKTFINPNGNINGSVRPKRLNSLIRDNIHESYFDNPEGEFWNEMFEFKNIPKIERMINIGFKNYDKNLSLL